MEAKRKHFRAFLAILAGFVLAFVFLLSLTVYAPLVGDLLVGGEYVTRDFPTVSSAALHTREMQMSSLALASFWFWCGVFVIGAFLAMQIWRWVRGF